MSALASAQGAEIWKEKLAESAHEVFEIMLNTPIEDTPSALIATEVTAVVGFAGSLVGNCVIQCSRTALIAIGEAMLGSALNEEEAIDAMGEVCNMLAGAWKRKVPAHAESCMLTVPTVIVGDQYQMHSPESMASLPVSFSFKSETVFAYLQVQMNG